MCTLFLCDHFLQVITLGHLRHTNKHINNFLTILNVIKCVTCNACTYNYTYITYTYMLLLHGSSFKLFSEVVILYLHTCIVVGLKFLVWLCTNLGMKDAEQCVQKLKKGEKSREVKQQR